MFYSEDPLGLVLNGVYYWDQAQMGGTDNSAGNLMLIETTIDGEAGKTYYCAVSNTPITERSWHFKP